MGKNKKNFLYFQKKIEKNIKHPPKLKLRPYVTYLHHRRPGSICTGTKYREKLRQFGFIYCEIAEHIVPGERLEETMHRHKAFCLYYIDAHDNPDYQFAYNAFRREISSALHRSHLSARPATPDLSPGQAPAIGSTSSPSHLSPGQAPAIGSASSPSHLSPGQAPVIGSANQLGSYSVGQLRSALWLLTTVHYLSKSRVGRLLFKTALRLRRLLQRLVQTYHRARPQ